MESVIFNDLRNESGGFIYPEITYTFYVYIIVIPYT